MIIRIEFSKQYQQVVKCVKWIHSPPYIEISYRYAYISNSYRKLGVHRTDLLPQGQYHNRYRYLSSDKTWLVNYVKLLVREDMKERLDHFRQSIWRDFSKTVDLFPISIVVLFFRFLPWQLPKFFWRLCNLRAVLQAPKLFLYVVSIL